MKKAALSLCALALSGQAMALSLDLGVSENSVDAGFIIPFGPESMGSGSFLYESDRGHMYDFGLYAQGRSGIVSGKVGAKLYGTNLKNASGWGLAPGANLAFHFTPHIRLEGEYYYSPKILSWSDINNLKEFSTRLAFSPMPTADIYLGYRNVKFNTSNQGSKTLSTGGFVGITFTI